MSRLAGTKRPVPNGGPTLTSLQSIFRERTNKRQNGDGEESWGHGATGEEVKEEESESVLMINNYPSLLVTNTEPMRLKTFALGSQFSPLTRCLEPENLMATMVAERKRKMESKDKVEPNLAGVIKVYRHFLPMPSLVGSGVSVAAAADDVEEAVALKKQMLPCPKVVFGPALSQRDDNTAELLSNIASRTTFRKVCMCISI